MEKYKKIKVTQQEINKKMDQHDFSNDQKRQAKKNYEPEFAFYAAKKSNEDKFLDYGDLKQRKEVQNWLDDPSKIDMDGIDSKGAVTVDVKAADYHRWKEDKEKVQNRAKTRVTYKVTWKEPGMRDSFDSVFETKEEAEKFLKEDIEAKRKSKGTITKKRSDNYKLGQTWREDFDYGGMLMVGATATESWEKKDLEKLSDSFEDVNYHKPARSLNAAIKAKKPDQKQAHMKAFREACRQLSDNDRYVRYNTTHKLYLRQLEDE